MWTLVIIACLGFMYGCYWFVKTVSYYLFYEDMVKDTIRAMIRQEHLR